MRNQIRNLFAMAALCLTLAACQTAGLKPEAINTSGFPPAGWVTERSGKTVTYSCPQPRCKSPQLVGITPIKIRGDVEAAIRSGQLSRELLQALDNLVTVATKQQIKLSTPRTIKNANYSGFEHHMTFQTSKGPLYVIARSIVQKDRGSIAVSAALNKSTAERNLRKFLAQTEIRRVQ
ncbi:hypothetical protein [Roseibium suaedae]|uniref:DUF1795 domain-containing protein n=1 Tax=Roseibium suaedae TaxID=735517 RepID=A0A1M7G9J2_9HYPH|nr:hypothetical protein [Roseibium suaedae]SHM13062.1 hypothetical protein SAMN05444272_1855 [Roseibium suaedae]